MVCFTRTPTAGAGFYIPRNCGPTVTRTPVGCSSVFSRRVVTPYYGSSYPSYIRPSYVTSHGSYYQRPVYYSDCPSTGAGAALAGIFAGALVWAALA